VKEYFEKLMAIINKQNQTKQMTKAEQLVVDLAEASEALVTLFPISVETDETLKQTEIYKAYKERFDLLYKLADELKTWPRVIKTIAIDFDGVLTDGKHYLDKDGKLFFATHAKDNWAIAQLIQWGYEVDLVTSNDSETIKQYAADRKMGYVYSRDKDLQYSCAIVDSMQDINLIAKAGVVFCPIDADEEIADFSGAIVVPVRGGNGVINYIVQHLNHFI